MPSAGRRRAEPLDQGAGHTIPLGIKKSIAMVQVPGAILVLGVGTEQIQLLTRIDDPEVMAGVVATQAAEPGAAGFGEQLQRMTRSLGNGKSDRAQSLKREGWCRDDDHLRQNKRLGLGYRPWNADRAVRRLAGRGRAAGPGRQSAEHRSGPRAKIRAR